jgi:hypothetical protein
MIAFFEWIGSLSPWQAWSLLIFLCLVLSIVPYWGRVNRILRIHLRDEKPEIIDFSWRVSPDHLLAFGKEKRYYIRPETTTFLLEGSVIRLNWDVRGAYRIDIPGIGNNITGNSVCVVARKNNRHFTLIAHTPKGKLERSIEIDLTLFRTLKTFNLSRERHFEQPTNEQKVRELSQITFKGRAFSRTTLRPLKQAIRSLPRLLNASIGQWVSLHNARYLRLKQVRNQNDRKKELDDRLKSQALVKGFLFKPSRYNQALENLDQSSTS